MNRLLDRLWVGAVLCLAGGLASRLVLAIFAPPQDRAQAWEQWSIQLFWYATGLLLFLAHLWRLGTSGRPPEEVPSGKVALLWVAGAGLAFLLLVWSALPSD
jgi:hypothetical protein